MFYAGLSVHLLIIVYEIWYRCLLDYINRDKYNAKIFMLIGRIFHDYLMTNRWQIIDDLKYSQSTTNNHRQLDHFFHGLTVNRWHVYSWYDSILYIHSQITSFWNVIVWFCTYSTECDHANMIKNLIALLKEYTGTLWNVTIRLNFIRTVRSLQAILGYPANLSINYRDSISYSFYIL